MFNSQAIAEVQKKGDSIMFEALAMFEKAWIFSF